MVLKLTHIYFLYAYIVQVPHVKLHQDVQMPMEPSSKNFEFSQRNGKNAVVKRFSEVDLELDRKKRLREIANHLDFKFGNHCSTKFEPKSITDPE